MATNTTAYNPEKMAYHILLACIGFSYKASSSLASDAKLLIISQALLTISSFSLPFGRLICLVTAHINTGGNSKLATSGHLATLPNSHTSTGISTATATTILVKNTYITLLTAAVETRSPISFNCLSSTLHAACLNPSLSVSNSLNSPGLAK